MPLPPPELEPVSHLGTTVQAFVGRPLTHDALLADAAARWPDRVAIEAPSGTATYAELDAAVTSMAHGVRRIAERGDTVAVALSHDVRAFCAPFVASRAGVRVLLLNTRLSPSSWTEQLAVADPVAVIADAAHLDVANRAGERDHHLVVNADLALPLDGETDVDFGEADPDQVLALIATSGTTGVPKMTQVTTGGLVHAGLAYSHLLGLDAADRSYICLPLHYIGPLSAQTTTMCLVGGTTILPEDTSAVGAAERMAAANATYVDAVPAWLALLLRQEPVDVPSWRTVIYGGAPMPPETAAGLAERYPSLTLWDVWGLSETHGPATGLRVDPAAPAPPGTVGRPLPGVEVRVAADGHSPSGGVAAEGEGPGELLVRGRNVTPGYADDAALTADVLLGGWLRTGDIGTVEGDGTVRLLDRAKDVIMRGGANVFSVEVEQALARHDTVAEAAVYGVPDGRGEESVHAVVVLSDGAELDVLALRAAVAEAIGRHAVPRRIEAADALPRNPTGKVDKRLLREQAAGGGRLASQGAGAADGQSGTS